MIQTGGGGGGGGIFKEQLVFRLLNYKGPYDISQAFDFDRLFGVLQSFRVSTCTSLMCIYFFGCFSPSIFETKDLFKIK